MVTGFFDKHFPFLFRYRYQPDTIFLFWPLSPMSCLKTAHGRHNLVLGKRFELDFYILMGQFRHWELSKVSFRYLSWTIRKFWFMDSSVAALPQFILLIVYLDLHVYRWCDHIKDDKDFPLRSVWGDPDSQPNCSDSAWQTMQDWEDPRNSERLWQINLS